MLEGECEAIGNEAKLVPDAAHAPQDCAGACVYLRDFAEMSEAR